MAKNYYKYHARKLEYYCPVGRVVTSSSLERKVCGSNLGPVKSDTVLPTACPRCNISSDEAELPWRKDAKINPANSLHVLPNIASIIKALILINTALKAVNHQANSSGLQ